MKALVTGANGFIGSHLVDALFQKGYEVKCLVRKTSDLKWIDREKVKLVYGDITQKKSLFTAVEEVDYVYHTAALVRAVNWQKYYWVNQYGTRNLIQVCAQINPGLKKFVYLSSQAASGPAARADNLVRENDCPRPITDYGKSKLKGEEEILNFKNKVPFVILRPCPVYGPREKGIYKYFKMAKWGIIPVLGREKRYVNLCYIKDLVAGSILAAENEKSRGKIYFIGDGRIYSWSQIGGIISKSLNVKGIKIVIPEKLLSIVSFFNGGISKITQKPAVVNSQKVLEMKQKYWLFDISQIKEDLGFLPKFPLSIGAKLSINWYRQNHWL
ncbi:NAD-dependent epimerase/dehydratase family protein [bacterium]|nr:NAD-dependent epimerase/dehydratase family protein [bacterium]